MEIIIETESIDSVTDEEMELIRNADNTFSKCLSNYDSFYVTVFENDNNRKIGLYFSYGKLRKVSFDKLDMKKQ